jgi:sugar phosphate isomerase/epimerase
MTVGLSTAHLLVPGATVSGILDELGRLAPAAVELGAGGPEGLGRGLIGALATGSRGVPVVALEAFCPGPRPLAGPALAARDATERAAAARLAGRTILAAAELGARFVVVALGVVGFDTESARLRAGFERGEAQESLWREKRAERAAAAGPHLDLARLALEPLLRLAESAGVVLAVTNRPDYAELPAPEELLGLLADFAGAPLGPWFDTAAAHGLEVSGAAAPGATLAAFGRGALGVHLTDAAGLARGLPPGTGEVDFPALAAALPATAPRFVHCAPGAFPREIAASLQAMRAVFTPA